MQRRIKIMILVGVSDTFTGRGKSFGEDFLSTEHSSENTGVLPRENAETWLV